MRTKTVTLYKFGELSPEVQEKVVERMFDFNVFCDWWDCDYDQIDRAAELLGIEIDRRRSQGKQNGPDISFSGFDGRGDYISFSGHYSYKKGCKSAITKEFPSDKTLAKIAADLVAAQKSLSYKGEARISERRGGVSIDADSESIEEAIQDFVHWAFRLLETDYEFLTSRDQIVESIEANELEFEENGSLA